MRRVVVTGISALSPLGLTAESSWQSAIAGESGIRSIDIFDASPLKTRIAGLVDPFELTNYLTPTAPIPEGHRRNRFALAATEVAMRDSGLREAALDPTQWAIAFGSNESHHQPEQMG